MIKRLSGWFRALPIAGKIVTIVVASVVGLGAIGAATGYNQPAKPTSIQSANTSTTESKDVVTHQTITETEDIPFTTTQVENSSLTKGTTQTKTEGSNGVRTHTFDVTYTNGVETSRVEVSNTTTTEPVTKVVAIGTYEKPVEPSCPNGTYTNSAGNVVCSPYQSNSVPAGATAQCRDGTYSFSQSRSGTCSHHGGVAEWL
jgi:hypothetical protein